MTRLKKTFYVTTPIYYPNGIPHAGTAYTTIAADVLARWHRMREGTAFFLTGTDEHGQKVEKTAKAAGVPVKQHVDGIVSVFKEAWEKLGIRYDDFIRTTEARHVECVLEIFEALRGKGDIYKGHYEGWYCVSCETFWLESQLAQGHCPNPECGKPVELLKEEEYFFRLSAYQERILEYYRHHPNFVRPEVRFNEMKSFVSRGLEDVCVSRKGLSWGIPVPGDPERSIYVWIDALTNYITAIGYKSNRERFESLWPADFHLVGKDILRFHAVIWPAMLMALDLPLPASVFANGWLTIGGSKISKSRGEHRNLMELLDLYGPDSIRYFLMREAAFGEDMDFSEEGIVRRLNTDLANDLGNLVHRVLSMIHRYCDGKVPGRGEETDLDRQLRLGAEKLPEAIASHLEVLAFREALLAIWGVVVSGNRYVDETAPWKLKKEKNDTRLGTVLYHLAALIRWVSVFLSPFLPFTAESIWGQLGLPGFAGDQPLKSLRFDGIEPGLALGEARPLFRKVETAEKA